LGGAGVDAGSGVGAGINAGSNKSSVYCSSCLSLLVGMGEGFAYFFS
jgi:hypothetical protein